MNEPESLIRFEFEGEGRITVQFQQERLLKLLADSEHGKAERSVASLVGEEMKRALFGFLVAPGMLAEAAVTGSASRRISPPEGWQPIETAPRDKKVLIWNEVYVMIAELKEVAGHPIWHSGGAPLAAGEPSHWMPLPEKPQRKES